MNSCAPTSRTSWSDHRRCWPAASVSSCLIAGSWRPLSDRPWLRRRQDGTAAPLRSICADTASVTMDVDQASVLSAGTCLLELPHDLRARFRRAARTAVLSERAGMDRLLPPLAQASTGYRYFVEIGAMTAITGVGGHCHDCSTSLPTRTWAS